MKSPGQTPGPSDGFPVSQRTLPALGDPKTNRQDEMMDEHPIEQPINSVDVLPEGQFTYAVGRDGVTRIEACQKSGEYSHIPYLRVWAGDVCLAEFCQHKVFGVYFAKPA